MKLIKKIVRLYWSRIVNRHDYWFIRSRAIGDVQKAMRVKAAEYAADRNYEASKALYYFSNRL